MIFTENTTRCPFNLEIGLIVLFDCSILEGQKEKLIALLNVLKSSF